MAVDSEDKRRAAIAVGVPGLIIMPKPDGTIAGDDRKHIAGFYRGISSITLIRYGNKGFLLGVWNGRT